MEPKDKADRFTLNRREMVKTMGLATVAVVAGRHRSG